MSLPLPIPLLYPTLSEHHWIAGLENHQKEKKSETWVCTHHSPNDVTWKYYIKEIKGKLYRITYKNGLQIGKEQL